MRIGLVLTLFSFLALSVGSALSESLTYDEVFYLEEGRRIWDTRTFSDPYNPPLAPMLGRIPAALGFDGMLPARLVSVVFGVVLIIAVYRVGGLAAAAILAFEPTFLANSHYVTGDVAVTLFLFLATVAWMRLLARATVRRTVLLALACGYALVSKMTAIPFLAVALLAVWWRRRPRRGVAWFGKHRRSIVGSVVVTLAVIWASYLFTWDVVIRQRTDPGRLSEQLVAYANTHNLPIVTQSVTFLMKQPLPLGTYLATVKNNLLRVGKPAMVFFDGQIYDRTRWYFMIVNVVRKIPIPLLLLVVIGGIGPTPLKLRGVKEIGIGILLVSAFTGMVPLARYVLPAVPFLALAGARGIGVIGGKGGAVVALLLWYIVGTIAHYPHFVSYANELVGPREKRYEVLADSNLDWGQALPDLALHARREGIGTIRFSYFGRDDAGRYGLPSTTPYGGWRFEEICAFHNVVVEPRLNKEVTAISASNWYYCGYNTAEVYRKENVQEVVADVFLVFKK